MKDANIKRGATLMSTMIAVALSGLVGLAIINLIGSQQEEIMTVNLQEQRENLIKHYKQVVIDGWDLTTKSTGNHNIKNRSGGTAIPGSGLFLKNDLYGENTPGGWWKVTAPITCSSSGQIQHSDRYNTSTGSGLATEDMCKVELTVTYNPNATGAPVSAKLATNKEVIYLGSRYTSQSCGSDSNPTRRDKTASSTGKDLYHKNSTGAVISYNLKSNYAKCSQVPLVNTATCPAVGAYLGFQSQRKTAIGISPATYRSHHNDNRVTGRLACSYPTSGNWKTAMNNKRWYTLGDKVKNASTSGNLCHDSSVKRSFVKGVSRINSSGSSGGELLCHPDLIAPKTSYTHRTTSLSRLGNRSYFSYNGSTRRPYQKRHHIGGGGYTKATDGTIKHSGGLKKFTSTGGFINSDLRPHPDSDTYPNRFQNAGIRGRPGQRGNFGRCICGRP